MIEPTERQIEKHRITERIGAIDSSLHRLNEIHPKEFDVHVPAFLNAEIWDVVNGYHRELAIALRRALSQYKDKLKDFEGL